MVNKKKYFLWFDASQDYYYNFHSNPFIHSMWFVKTFSFNFVATSFYRFLCSQFLCRQWYTLQCHCSNKPFFRRISEIISRPRFHGLLLINFSRKLSRENFSNFSKFLEFLEGKFYKFQETFLESGPC